MKYIEVRNGSIYKTQKRLKLLPHFLHFESSSGCRRDDSDYILSVCVCVYVYMYVCMCVCVCVYIYIYIYISYNRDRKGGDNFYTFIV
jgi:hypothetical protein